MSKPSITALEKSYVADAMEKGDIGVGPYEEKFEKAWADWNDRKYGVSCSSGTTAIHLAVMAMGIGLGDEVIVPEFTMISTAWAVSLTGATPVFADCDDDLIVRKWPITEKTKAVITVPIYGRKAPIPKGIPVIEDMAEAHGIKPQGDIACYSFYGNKILTTGEGGMCLTDNPEWRDRMVNLKNAMMNKERTMLHEGQGYNYRMTNLQAAVGLAQVERIEEILKKRVFIESWYDKYLPEAYKMPPREVLWMYDIRTDHQEELKAYLSEKGIPTRYGFKPMSMQPQYSHDGFKYTSDKAIEIIKKNDKEYLNDLFGKVIIFQSKNKKKREYEHLNAYKWSKRILYLPTYTDITQEEVKKICQTIQSFEPK